LTGKGQPRSLVWLRNDLRLRDNPALDAARRDGPVVAVYCWCPEQWRSHGMGPRRMAFLLRHLRVLANDLAARGIPLHILRAERFNAVPDALLTLAQSLGVSAVHCNAEYPVDEQRRDRRVAQHLQQAGGVLHCHHGNVLSPPGSILTKGGTMPAVFSAFRRRWLAQTQAGEWQPLPLVRSQDWPQGHGKAPALHTLPVPDDVDEGLLAELWPAGEDEAQRRLKQFIQNGLADYQRQRDLPAVPGTSQLSPYLAIGAISARQALAAAMQANHGRRSGGRAGADTWINELLWREFYQHLTAALPRLSMGRAFKPETENLAWRDDSAALEAWQQGRTGYPLVDAGMRQLNATGWMHNRLRMICAMFLSKHLLLDWRLGEAWFMQQLVDGDFAANNGGWQWSASTGCDAVPYFRIFNPITQAKRFDPDGIFVRTWVPEVEALAPPDIFEPWKAPLLAPAYPAPIVDHRMARERALAAFKSLK
jgi:deoxyribodipyrimidine photo-lyase